MSLLSVESALTTWVAIANAVRKRAVLKSMMICVSEVVSERIEVLLLMNLTHTSSESGMNVTVNGF